MSAWVRGNLLWKGRIFKKKSEIPQNDLTKPNIEGQMCDGLSQCKWEELQGKDWVWLLQLQPELAVRCNWSVLSAEDWQQLQEAQPQLYEKWHIDQ